MQARRSLCSSALPSRWGARTSPGSPAQGGGGAAAQCPCECGCPDWSADRCADTLAGLLHAGRIGEAQVLEGGSQRALAEADIAVLVHTNREAMLMQSRLRAYIAAGATQPSITIVTTITAAIAPSRLRQDHPATVATIIAGNRARPSVVASAYGRKYGRSPTGSDGTYQSK